MGLKPFELLELLGAFGETFLEYTENVEERRGAMFGKNCPDTTTGLSDLLGGNLDRLADHRSAKLGKSWPPMMQF